MNVFASCAWHATLSSCYGIFNLFNYVVYDVSTRLWTPHSKRCQRKLMGTIGWWWSFLCHWWLSIELFSDLVDYAFLENGCNGSYYAWVINYPLNQSLHKVFRLWSKDDTLVERLVLYSTVNHLCDYDLHQQDWGIVNVIGGCTIFHCKDVPEGPFDQVSEHAFYRFLLNGLNGWFFFYLDQLPPLFSTYAYDGGVSPPSIFPEMNVVVRKWNYGRCSLCDAQKLEIRDLMFWK